RNPGAAHPAGSGKREPSQGQLSLAALAAKAAQLDRGPLGCEAVLVGPIGKPLLDDLVRELVNVSAAGADRERRGAAGPLMPLGTGAADEGVDGFEPVRESLLDQLFERAIDLERRAQALAAKAVEDVVGRERRVGCI